MTESKQIIEPIVTYPWHTRQLQHVTQQIRDNRQPHATLFELREGFDDTSLGWNVIKNLLCDTGDGCDECKHCRLVQEKTHSNVLFLDVINDKVGIDNVRELEQEIWQTAMFDKPKVAYIQGIESLSSGAQNALLKTLEEPPENTYFVLSVRNISLILPTIMSRVQRLTHGNLDTATIISWLQNNINQLKDEAEIEKIAQLSGFEPLITLELLNLPESMRILNIEKTQFASFVAGKCSADSLCEHLKKDCVGSMLARYRRYTENIILHLFEQSVVNNADIDKSQQNSVQYEKWNGVSLRGLYDLLDVFSELRALSDTNVNMELQFNTTLTEWQHERR